MLTKALYMHMNLFKTVCNPSSKVESEYNSSQHFQTLPELKKF